jgi:hypothetical protein
MFLIDDLLFAPISGFKFVLRTLEKVAQEQYTDDAPLKERLLELQLLLDNGEISESEYTEQETALLRELREIANRKRELAGASREERGPLSGRVVEGSGAEITFHPEEHNYE